MNTPDYFVLCETTTTDKKGRISLINIFDSLIAPSLPLKSDKFSVAFSVEISPEILGKTLELTVEIIDPNGQTVFNATGHIDSKVSEPQMNAARVISAIEISKASFKIYGDYKYRLKINDDIIEENCLRVLREHQVKQIERRG